ncbi:hypothetical protein OJJOAM_000415 [Cupriavidus sp. H18C1]
MICSGEAMRSGLPVTAGRSSGLRKASGWAASRAFSHGSTASGSIRLDTVKPVRPALGLAPRPVAPSSRISPPAPVEAPGNGEIAVGWLCVSTFISVWVSA